MEEQISKNTENISSNRKNKEITVADIRKLPNCIGKIVAFMPCDKGIQIYVEDIFPNSKYLREMFERQTGSKARRSRTKRIPQITDNYIYDGDPANFIKYLRKATMIATCNLKSFMHLSSLFAMESKLIGKTFEIALATWLIDPNSKEYQFSELKNKKNINEENHAKAVMEIAKKIFSRLEDLKLLKHFFEMEMPLVPIIYKMEKTGMLIDRIGLQNFKHEVESKLKENNYESSKNSLKVLKSNINKILELLTEENIIHANINQFGTATGRFTVSKPPLQNMPAHDEFNAKIRKYFIAHQGHVLISADYSQIEFRVLAHLSRDPKLEIAFSNNEDLHIGLASLLFKKNSNEITKQEREMAKRIGYGVIYGMGVQKLAEDLGKSEEDEGQLKQLRHDYLNALAYVKEYYNRLMKSAEKHIPITSLAGRPRSIVKDKHNKRDYPYYKALNSKIQSSSADIIKQAMLDFSNDAKMKKWGAKLILQIHDELIIEVPEEFAEEATTRLIYIMEKVKVNGEKLIVPLIAKGKYGEKWHDIK